MPRKKKKETKEDGVKEIAKTVTSLVPIAELLQANVTVFGEKPGKKIARDAKFSPEFLEVATRLVAAGLTQKDLAFVLNTTPARIQFWMRKNELFRKACLDGKGVAKSYLIAQGLKAAGGFYSDEVNYKIKRKVLDDGTIVEFAAEESHFKRFIKPDSTLLMFMLCNLSRQLKDKELWTSQHKIEVDETKKISIKISGKVATEQISRLAGAFLPTVDAEIVEPKQLKESEES